MTRPVKVRFSGEIVDGVELNFEAINESWNEYACDDGSTVRIKVVVLKVTRLLNKFSATGEPIFVISSNNVVAATPPPGTIPPLEK